MRQRRWAERGRFVPVAGPRQQTKRDTERLQQRLLIVGAAVVALILIGLVGTALYFGVYAPPRRIVAKVGDETVRLRDVPPYMLLSAGEPSASTPTGAFSTLLRDTILLQRAGSLGVTVPPEEIDRAIVRRFDPPEDPEAEVPSTLSEEGQADYTRFLDLVDVDENLFRRWTEARPLLERLRDHFNAAQPAEAEQVFVHWIIAQDEANAQKAKERLDGGEPFADVAGELHVGTDLDEENGEVGWVPRGAFPDLDATFFEAENVGKVTDPIDTSLGWLIVLVEKGPEQRAVSDQMREQLASNQFQTWLDDQVNALVTDVSFTQEDSNWVIERLTS